MVLSLHQQIQLGVVKVMSTGKVYLEKHGMMELNVARNIRPDMLMVRIDGYVPGVCQQALEPQGRERHFVNGPDQWKDEVATPGIYVPFQRNPFNTPMHLVASDRANIVPGTVYRRTDSRGERGVACQIRHCPGG